MTTKWAVQTAKARFSEFLKASVEQGPQVVTLRGVETAVLVPIAEYRRLKASAKPDLKHWLLESTPKFDIPLQPRDRFTKRAPVDFE